MAAVSISSPLGLRLSEATYLQVGAANEKGQCRWSGEVPALSADTGLRRSLHPQSPKNLHYSGRYKFPSVSERGGRTLSGGACFALQEALPPINRLRSHLKGVKSKGPCEALSWGGRKQRDSWPLIRKKEARKLICKASDSPFNSSIIQQESLELGKLFSTLVPLQAKYFDFDLEGKKIYCEQMEVFLDKLQVFTTRYRLMDDPTAKEYVRRLDAMMLEAGTNSYAALNSFREAIAAMKHDIEEQERLGPNYKRPNIGTASLFRPEFDQLCRTDPEVQEAMGDPLILKAVQDVASNPANLRQYASNPRLKKFFEKIIDPRFLEQSGM